MNNIKLTKQDIIQKFNSTLIQHCVECQKEDAVDTATGLCEDCFQLEPFTTEIKKVEELKNE